MKKTLLSIVTTAVLACTASSNLIAAENKTELSNKEKTIAVLNSIETGDHDAIAYINAKNYTQHNLGVADGLAGFGEVLSHLPKGSAKVSVKRAFEDGDYVFTHTDYNFFGPKVGFDLFRFEDGLIVEHWDNLAVKAKKSNPSGHTQFDGATEITDLDKTEANKTLIKNFVSDVLVKGDMSKLAAYFDGDNYIQHNTDIADGLSGFGAAVKAMAEQGIKMVFTKNHKVLGEGNFVLSISEGTFAGKPTSFYDLFRIENGKIAEHWDVIETIIPEDQHKNGNGKFGNLSNMTHAEQSNQTLKVATAFLEAAGSGDGKTLNALMSDEFVWHNEGDNNIPWIGNWEGKDKVMNTFMPLFGAGLKVTSWSTDYSFANGDQAAFFGTMSAIANNSGVDTGKFTWAVRVNVENGKVQSWNWLEDSFAVSKAYTSK